MSTFPLCIRVNNEIELRLNELRYAEEYFALIVQNVEHLQTWMSWATPEPTLETTKAFMKARMHQFAEGMGLPTTLWYRGQMVGSMDYPRISWEKRQAEIGYWLDKNMQGNGIITLATKTFITYAFQEYGLNKVEIHAAAGNQRSRAVPERLGFTLEGTIRQATWLNGNAHNMVIYGMLASEWQSKQSK